MIDCQKGIVLQVLLNGVAAAGLSRPQPGRQIALHPSSQTGTRYFALIQQQARCSGLLSLPCILTYS
jgi:hypothetical protein